MNQISQIDQVGYSGWNTFYDQTQRWFNHDRGRGVYWSHKYIKAFREIAAHCMENGINIVDYITRSFEVVEKNHQYIVPRDFAGADAFERYRMHRNRFGSRPEEAWKRQVLDLVDLDCRLIPGKFENEISILTVAIMPFEAWFRVLYPEIMDEYILEMYGQAAHKELNADRALLSYLRKNRGDNVIQLEHRIGIFVDTAAGGNS